MAERAFAVVTGASTGIGLELARCAAEHGCDLLIAADEARIEAAADELRGTGTSVDTVQADLGTKEGIDTLCDAIGPRKVDYLMANAGRGLGGAFLDQEWSDIAAVIHTNITGTSSLLHRMASDMRARHGGRILITGSVAGLMPGSFHAVYNASKAYLDTLSWAIRNELEDSGITVTCLMPGPTDTEFFNRAHMQDTPMGRDEDKDDAAMVARQGFEAMLAGRSGITTGFMNKVQATLSGVIPDSVLAAMHRRQAKPEEDRNA